MDKINKITTSDSRIPVLVKKKENQQDNKPTYFSTPTKHPSTLKITTSDSRTPVLVKKNGNQQDNKPTYFSTPTKHINSSGYDSDSDYDSSSSTFSTPTTPSMLSRTSSNNSVFSKSMDTLNSISGAKIEELRKRVYSITEK
jgi:hypothetical protein